MSHINFLEKFVWPHFPWLRISLICVFSLLKQINKFYFKFFTTKLKIIILLKGLHNKPPPNSLALIKEPFYLLMYPWVRNSGCTCLGMLLPISCSRSLTCLRMTLLTCLSVGSCCIKSPADLFTWWQHFKSHKREFPAAQRQAQCTSNC